MRLVLVIIVLLAVAACNSSVPLGRMNNVVEIKLLRANHYRFSVKESGSQDLRTYVTDPSRDTVKFVYDAKKVDETYVVVRRDPKGSGVERIVEIHMHDLGRPRK